MATHPRPAPRNAFADDFLSRLDALPEPDGAHEAATLGPWSVATVAYQGETGFALLREGESVDAGDEPYAVFRRRETALLAAAVLPATGREPLFRLLTDADASGFPLRGRAALQAAAAGTADAAGHLRDFDEDFAAALHVAAMLARSPAALATLLEAAGPICLNHAGRILAHRLG